MDPSLEQLKKQIEDLKAEQATESKKMATLKGEEKTAQQEKIKGIKTQITAAEEQLKKLYPEEANTSKGAAKKAANKKQAKEASSQGKQQQQPETAVDYEKFTCPTGGVLPIHQSAQREFRSWAKISELKADSAAVSGGTPVWIRARVQTIRPQGNKLVFFALRQKVHTVQAVLTESEESKISRPMLKWAAKISDESIVNVKGSVVKSPVPITTCTQTDVEVQILEVWLESRAQTDQPLKIADCARPVSFIQDQKKNIKQLEKKNRRS